MAFRTGGKRVFPLGTPVRPEPCHGTLPENRPVNLTAHPERPGHRTHRLVMTWYSSVGRFSALPTSGFQAGRIMDDLQDTVNHPELWPFSPFTGRDLPEGSPSTSIPLVTSSSGSGTPPTVFTTCPPSRRLTPALDLAVPQAESIGGVVKVFRHLALGPFPIHT